MSTKSTKLSFEKTIHASPESVYQAFTNAFALSLWFCDRATVNPKMDGRLYTHWNAGFYACGEFTKLSPGKSLQFTWYGRGYPKPTKVKVAFQKVPDGTRVLLTHAGIGTSSRWMNIREEISRGWDFGLKNLASVLELGEDQRFTRRPMLGIMIGGFNPEIARKNEVPVTSGIFLDGVVDGMGAAQSGLMNKDVIVEMNGKATTDTASLVSALQGQQAGDSIEVGFFRGKEKRTTKMVLSGRPIPAIPDSAMALASEIKEKYLRFQDKLNRQLIHITDEQAAKRVFPQEWSIKENLAHLIHSERTSLQFINEILEGQVSSRDDYAGNIEPPIQATLAAFSTLSEIQTELYKLQNEVVNLLASLPTSFVENRGFYWNVAYNQLEGFNHHNGHLDQIEILTQALLSKSP